MSLPHQTLSRADWHARWLDRARHIASWSKDPSTKVGCVLVRGNHAIAEGYNGFPKMVYDFEHRLHHKPTKYAFTCHAEANAIAMAARFGVRVEGAFCYTTWAPCQDCSKLLIQAGVVACFFPSGLSIHEPWLENLKQSAAMFMEAGTALLTYPDSGHLEQLLK